MKTQIKILSLFVSVLLAGSISSAQAGRPVANVSDSAQIEQLQAILKDPILATLVQTAAKRNFKIVSLEDSIAEYGNIFNTMTTGLFTVRFRNSQILGTVGDNLNFKEREALVQGRDLVIQVNVYGSPGSYSVRLAMQRGGLTTQLTESSCGPGGRLDEIFARETAEIVSHLPK